MGVLVCVSDMVEEKWSERARERKREQHFDCEKKLEELFEIYEGRSALSYAWTKESDGKKVFYL